MKKIIIFMVVVLFFASVIGAVAKDKAISAKTKKAALVRKIPLSEETQECIDCHKEDTPGIVEDWLSSRHANITPEMAMKKPLLERRISSQSVPKNLRSVAVGCYECHSLNPENHKDNFEHADYKINVIVSPNDCKTCHSQEAEQFFGTKKAHAVDNLEKNSFYHDLVESITSIKEIKGNRLVPLEASKNAKNETCFACHGTEVKVVGRKKIPTSSEDMYVPQLSNWPNQGIGRINPDGSAGACTACHPRHSFSIEIARKPETCAQCHRGPDVPAYEVYKDSKHSNIFESKKQEWNWNNVPWVVGKDFKAPTCAVCHNSLIVDSEGSVLAQRTHDFGARLWVRIFGLIYSHPQPKDGKTYIIKNKDDQPLPTSFDGELASAEYLIDKGEQARRQKGMKKVCQGCHGSDVVDEHFAKMNVTIKETDRMVAIATQLMQKAWDKGLADRTNPFDESIERKWIEQWLFYANSIRYGSAMGSYDHTTFHDGWWDFTKNLQEMHEWITERSKEKTQ